MVTPPLEARGVACGYGGPPVLLGASLALQPGRVTALIGRSASGKSTLLRCLAGLVPLAGGDVRLRGRPIAGIPRRAFARAVALVPQGLPALPEVTVCEFAAGGRYPHLGWWRRPTPDDRAAVERALARTETLGCAQRLLRELSGGERQRVLVARALAQEADCILCDEPTAALDLHHQLEILELLADLSAASSRAVLIATHDLNLASQFADEVALLHAGRIAAHGRPSDVLTRNVLAPVYGEELWFGELQRADGTARPLVLPCRARRGRR
jgi:iron complex transport system ATP-binding protein